MKVLEPVTFDTEKERLADWVQRFVVISTCISFVILVIDKHQFCLIQLLQVLPVLDTQNFFFKLYFEMRNLI